MGKWISILLGLILIALGIWGIVERWWEYVWPFVYAGLVVMAILVGLGALVFGISEVRSAAEERRVTEPVAPPPPPSAPAESMGSEQKTQ